MATRLITKARSGHGFWSPPTEASATAGRIDRTEFDRPNRKLRATIGLRLEDHASVPTVEGARQFIAIANLAIGRIPMALPRGTEVAHHREL